MFERSQRLLAGLLLFGAAATASAQQATITLTPDASCYTVGSTVTVTVELSDVSGVDEVVGGQFLLWYDTATLTFGTVSPAATVFTELAYQNVNGAEIDFGVGVPTNPPAPGALSGTMGIITFSADVEVCNVADLVTFRADDPPLRTRLSAVLGGEVVSIQTGNLTRNNLSAISIDSTDPTGTAPTPVTVECDDLLPTPATDYASFVAQGGTANDNCTPQASLVITHVDGPLIGDVCGGTVTRTYTITDSCGNDIDVNQIITVDDITDPTGTAPTPVTVQCDDVLPTAATDYAGFVAQGGTADDNCTPQANLVITHVDGPLIGDVCAGTVTRTYTIADSCANSIDVDQIITVADTTDPTITAPDDISVQCPGDEPAAVTVVAEFLLLAGADLDDNCTVQANLVITHVSDVSDGFTCPEVITRTYRVTDDCGNTHEDTQLITVDDTIDPTITAPNGISVQCPGDVPAAVTVVADFLLLAGANLDDNCTLQADLVITHVSDVSDGNTCPEVITRTYRVTDGCGNTHEDTQLITVDDTIDPTITAPDDVSVQCPGDVPAAVTVVADFLLLAGANLDDDCTPQASLVITHVSDVSDGFTCPEVITRTYRVTDECGNTHEDTQLITVDDTIDPTITAPNDISVQCPGDVPAAVTVVADFLLLAGADLNDNCTLQPDLVITHVGDVSDGNTCPEVITRTYRVTDECGYTHEDTQLITVDDTIAPTFTLPADITSNADAGVCTLTLTLAEIGEPTLADNCSDLAYLQANMTWQRSDATPNLDDPFTQPVTTITWTVTDECGNYETDPQLTDQTITLLAFNDFVVDVQLQSTLHDPTPGVPGDTLDRCIHFTFDCDTGNPVEVRDELITFSADDDATNGLSLPNQLITDLPCGVYSCVTAEDELHSLRVKLDLAISDDQYVAGFTGASQLVQGDLFNDFPDEERDVIDILDFAVYITQWGASYGPVTCATPYPHADLDGDGVVDVSDYSFVQLNFFRIGDPDCCSGARAGGGVRLLLSISVKELIRRDLRKLAVADLTGDGVVDLDDIAAFMSGARPPGPSGNQEVSPAAPGADGPASSLGKR